MAEQSERSVVELWDKVLGDDGPAALVIKEVLRPVAGPRTPVAPPTFAGGRPGESDYHWDGEDPANWSVILQAVAENRIANRCTLDSIPSQANRMEGSLKRLEGTAIPKIKLTGVNRASLSLLEVGHRVADAALWSTDHYGEFQQGLEAYVRGDSQKLAALAPTSLIFGYWDSRGTTGGKARRLVRSEIYAENVVKLTRRSQYWATVDPEANEELQKALDDAKAKAKGDKEKDVGSQLGFRDAPASGLGGVIVYGDIVRLTILSLTGLRNLSARSERGEEDAPATKRLRRYLLALMLAAASSSSISLDLREGCLLVQNRKKQDGKEVPDICWTAVYPNGQEEPKTPSSALDDYVKATAKGFFSHGFPQELELKFDGTTAAQRVREKLAAKEKGPGTNETPRTPKKK